MAELIEGVDYHLYYLDFANRANPALSVLNDDGTADVYLNTLYDRERLRQELEHELRHLREQHFHVDISLDRAERQADGEPACIIGHTAPDRIPHFYSEAHFAHWCKTLAEQRDVDLSGCRAADMVTWEKTQGKREKRSRGV